MTARAHLRKKERSGSAPARSRRVLIVSHSHPEISKGGAEIAAHTLFRELNATPGFEAWYLGAARGHASEKLGTVLSQPWSEREYLYACGPFDWFRFSNLDRRFPAEFRRLLEDIQPDVVHFHHILNFGIEAIAHVRDILPQAKIVLTLHEYLPICHHYGQMVTPQDRALCTQSSPNRCHRCFPEISPADFFLRRMYIRRFFDLVDQFVAPSEFLASRYREWGLPVEKLQVVENVLPRKKVPLTERSAETKSGPLRIGFFGQVSALKGINVIFDTAELLEFREEANVAFEVYGDASGQPAEFQAEFKARLQKVGHNVKYMGSYEQARVDALMRSVDAVIVPSIWWENSPIVIQEARRNRVPVLCSNVGGMAEKVRDGVDGIHFPVGSALGLAALLENIASNRALLPVVGYTADLESQACERFVHQIYSR
jgi:glycosyltransferase involved in cell wall biosynthesis